MNQASSICEAMREAHIEDPDSYEGKHFCTEKCPYPFCVVFENSNSAAAAARKKVKEQRTKAAFALRKLGLSKEEIAKRLGVHPHTIYQYLRYGK